MGAMPGDRSECRRHVLNCVKLEEKALSAADRQHLLKLATTWRQLAVELEATQAILTAISGMNDQVPPS
jgi:hypothetical protein